MALARDYPQSRIDVVIPAQVQQADQLVTALPVGLLALRRGELLVIHRMIMLIEPHHHRPLVVRIIRNEQIGGVGDENPARVEEAIFLEHLLHRPVEPLLPALVRHVLDGLAQGVVIARHFARVEVLVIEPLALDPNGLGLRVQMFAGQFRRQGAQQAAALHHPLESRIRVLQVQLEAQIGGQLKPERHLLLLAGGGHRLGQAREDLFPKAQFEELLFVGLADNLDLVELALAKSLQDLLLMVFDDLQVHLGGSGQRTILR